MKKIVKIFSIIFIFFLMCITINAQENRALFDDSEIVNTKLKNLTDSSNITEIRRSYNAPNIEEMTSENIISKSDSYYPIYAWYQDKIIYYYTEDEHPILQSGYNLFNSFIYVNLIDLTGVDTSNVTDMSNMFYNCSSLQVIVVSDTWNTENVQNSSNMFFNCLYLMGPKGTIYDNNKNDKEYARLDSPNNPGYFSETIPENKIYWAEKTLKGGTHRLTLSNNPLSGNHYGISYYGIALWKEYNSSITEVHVGAVKPLVTTGWFMNIKNLAIDLQYLDTSNVIDMSNMFSGYSGSSLDLSSFDTKNVTTMRNMFSGCSNLSSLDLSNFDTSNVISMNSMFSGCSNLSSLDLSSFDTSKVEDMSYMFYSSDRLQIIKVSDKWNTNNVENSSSMFYGCSSLSGKNFTLYNNYITDKEYARIDSPNNPGYFSDTIPENKIYWALDGYNCGSYNGNCKLTLSNNLITGYIYDSGVSYYGISMWSENKQYISSVKIGGENDIIKPIFTTDWFENTKISNIDLQYLDTSNVINMNSMFSGCSNLSSLDLSNFDTSNVISMNNMFSGCSNLSSLDLSNFDTSNVISMNNMFSGCSNLSSLDLSNFDTSNVISMSNMFSGCSNLLSLDLSSFDTSKVTNMSNMFENNKKITSLDLSSFDTKKVSDMSSMFYGCSKLQIIKVSNKWNTDNVQNSYRMFYNCNNLEGKNGTIFNSNVIDKEYARLDEPNNPGYFSDTIPENKIYWAVDGSGCDNSNDNCKLTLSNNPIEGDHHDSGITYRGQAYWSNYNNSITEVQIGAEDDIIKPLTVKNWFSNMSKITNVDLQYLDTSNILNMSSLFEGCSNLELLDLSPFDTSKVTNMTSMFKGCSKLQVIKVSNKWNIDNVQNSENMFYNCRSLMGQNGTIQEINIYAGIEYARLDEPNNPGFFSETIPENKIYFAVDGTHCGDSTGNCKLTLSNNPIEGNHFGTGVSYFGLPIWRYYYNSSITEVQIGHENDIVKPLVTAGWFSNMSKITSIDLQYLDTSNVLNMSSMFYGCSNLTTLDLSGLDTSKVTNMNYMFGRCSKLQIIKVSNIWNTENVINSENMFSNCSYLIGQNGTLFNDQKIDKEYARLDETNNPGYFSETNLENKIYWAVDGSSCNSYTGNCKLTLSNNPITGNHYDSGFTFGIAFWNNYNSSITEVQIGGENDIIKPLTTKHWFYYMQKVTSLDLKYLDTSKVSNMSYMFYKCSSLISLDLSSFVTSNVLDMSYMFSDCERLQIIKVSDKWTTENVLNSENMFYNCSYLVGQNGTLYNEYNQLKIDKEYARIDSLNNKGYFSDTIPDIKFYWAVDGELCDRYYENCKLTLSNKPIKGLHNIVGNHFDSGISYGPALWNKYYMSIKQVQIGKEDDIIKPLITAKWFNNMSNVTNIDLRYLDISNAVNKSFMFAQCDSLQYIIAKDEEAKEILKTTTTIKIVLDHPVTPVVSVSKGKNNSLKIVFEDAYANKYRIYRSTKKDSGFKLVKEISGIEKTDSRKNVEYIDEKLTYGKTYYYRVIAMSEDGNLTSDVVSKKLVPNKVNLRIVSAGTNNVKLSWDKVAETGYEIYSSTDNKKWTKVTTVTKNSTVEYNVKKLKSNKKYYFKVRAYKTVSGKKYYGSYSDVVSTKTAPEKPTVKLTLKDINSMNLKITASKGAIRYVIEKSVDDKYYESLGEVNEEGTYLEENQEVGFTYYYKVKACNIDNRCSSWTKVSLKQTPKTPKLTLTTTSKKVTATVGSVEGSDGYKLYVSTSKNEKYKVIKEFTSEEELLEYTYKTTKGKTYYFKVRSYTIVDGISKVYSPYSGIKKIKSK